VTSKHFLSSDTSRVFSMYILYTFGQFLLPQAECSTCRRVCANNHSNWCWFLDDQKVTEEWYCEYSSSLQPGLCPSRPCYLVCGLKSSSISCELARNAESQAPLQTYWVKVDILTRAPGNWFLHQILRSNDLVNSVGTHSVQFLLQGCLTDSYFTLLFK
jgi:hypothetical protein